MEGREVGWDVGIEGFEVGCEVGCVGNEVGWEVGIDSSKVVIPLLAQLLISEDLWSKS